MRKYLLAAAMLLCSMGAHAQEPAAAPGSTFSCFFGSQYNAPPTNVYLAPDYCLTYGFVAGQLRQPTSQYYDTCSPLNLTKGWWQTNYPNSFYYYAAYNVPGPNNDCIGGTSNWVGILTGTLVCPSPSVSLGFDNGVPTCGCPPQNGIPAYWELDQTGNEACVPDPVYINPYIVPNSSSPSSMYTPGANGAFTSAAGFVANASTQTMTVSDGLNLGLIGAFAQYAYANEPPATSAPTVTNDAGVQQVVASSAYSYVLGRIPLSAYVSTVYGLTVGQHYNVGLRGNSWSTTGAMRAPMTIAISDGTQNVVPSEIQYQNMIVGRSVATPISVNAPSTNIMSITAFKAHATSHTITVSSGVTVVHSGANAGAAIATIGATPVLKDESGNIISATWASGVVCLATVVRQCTTYANVYHATPTNLVTAQRYTLTSTISVTSPFASQQGIYYVQVQ